MTDAEKSVYWNAITNEWRIQREESARYKKAQETGICHVHNVKMTKKEVRIEYGIPRPIQPTYKEIPLGYEIDTFPHADRDIFNGGCITTTNSPMTKIISVCPKCTELKNEWIKNNPNQQVEPTEKTPVESGNTNRTEAHP